MVADSDIHLSKLDAILESFAAETSNEYKSKSVNYKSSQLETNIGSSGSVVVLRYGEELNIRDPISPVPTKGGLEVHPDLSLVLKILCHRRK